MKTITSLRYDLLPVVQVYCLKHLETEEYICLLDDNIDYLACFSSGDAALQFRDELGLQEHVEIHVHTVANCLFSHFWLDGKGYIL